MLYLDYDRMPGEWIPNAYGNNINLEALSFFKKLNSAIHSEFPEALMIAEESGSYGGITAPTESSGLGFDLKWNMGWANDFYDYLETNPLFRNEKHKALNFPLMYAFFEKYCLPISHDEVVHGKKSFIDKMFGSYEDKFLQARCALLLMMSYPGKKLLFMGTEYAQFREWNFDDSLEWFMTEYPSHRDFRSYVAALNSFYLESRELWEIDFDPRGFEWINPDDADKNAVAYKRRAKDGSELIFVLSFSGTEQTLVLPVSEGKRLECVFSSVPTDSSVVCGNSVRLLPFLGVALRERDDKIKIKI